MRQVKKGDHIVDSYHDEGWVRVSGRPERPSGDDIRCLVDGCPWRMTAEYELTDDGESRIDLHLNEHKIDELQNAARNGMLIDGQASLLQEKTTNIYVRAFLEWVRHQNSIEEAGIQIKPEPTEEEINDLLEGFMETDARFGN